MKIAMISHDYPPFAWGGVAAHCYHLSHQLVRKGAEVTVLCGGRKPSHTIEEDGLEVHRFPFADIPPHFMWFQAENIRRLRGLLRTYDIVHSEQGSGTMCAIFRRKLRFPWVVSFHGWSRALLRAVLASPGGWVAGDYRTYLLGFPIFHAITGLDLAFSDLGTVCSQTLAREFSSDYPSDASKIRVIPNGIDTDFFDSIGSEYANLESEEPTLFFCGRLFKIKGIDYLLEATRLLTRRYHSLRLKVFGDGPLRERTKEYVAASGLTKNVEVRSYVPYSTLVAELMRSTIAVFPSLYEAQSIAVLEAMACSKPVVAFDLPFSQELITHEKTGFLAKAMNACDLAACISRLLESEELRMTIGRNARQYVSSYHNWTKIADQYLQVYDEALMRSSK